MGNYIEKYCKTAGLWQSEALNLLFFLVGKKLRAYVNPDLHNPINDAPPLMCIVNRV